MSARCAYLVSRYPAVTHTFVQNEVQALRRRGLEIETMTVRRPPAEELLSPADRSEHGATHSLLPVGIARLAGVHGRAFLRSPLAYISTLARALRLGTGGLRAQLWQLFHFAEALLAHAHMRNRGMRHVHVHFANVASDVALLATHYANLADGGGWSWSLTIHGPTELLDLESHKLRAKVEDAALIACISDFARSQVLACLDGGDGSHVHTVRCGVDVSRFRPEDHREDGDVVRILNVAGMSRRKGQVELIEAMGRLREEGHPACLTIVGDGPERATLEAAVTRLGLGDDVTFVGALGHHQMPDVYAAADVFCLASFAEGVPTVLMEAMAAGLPVVTTNVMGIPELVEDGISGLIVPPARADALAAGLERLVADPELRHSMGRAARERVEQDYELERAAKALSEHLVPLIAR